MLGGVTRRAGTCRSWIARLLRKDEAAGVQELKRLIRRYDGVVAWAAKDAGVTRRMMFYWIWKYGLWETIDAARASGWKERIEAGRKRVVRDPMLENARALLRRRHGTAR